MDRSGSSEQLRRLSFAMKILQAGAVPFRERDGERQYLLVTSQRGNWIFPKGIVEPGETPDETALKEAREEAGIHGVILPDPVASYDDHKWRAECVVQLYLLHYAEDCRSWEEKHLRERRWCSYEEALSLIKKPKIRDALEKARERLDGERAL